MSKYKHLFFDLDNTLWDFKTNSFETLSDLYLQYDLKNKGISSLENFITVYHEHNAQLWKEYGMGFIKKKNLRTDRFHRTFNDFGIIDFELSENFGNDYIHKSPLKNTLFPYAIETLNYLSEKYTLHIITNGFEEVQHIKLENSGLKKFFKTVITSEMAGAKKPDKKIFHYALYRAKTKSKQCVMIGDDLEIDVLGAKNAGIDAIYFNPEKKIHKERGFVEINSLKELMSIL